MDNTEKIQELIKAAEASYASGDLKSAFENYREAARKGNGEAAYRLGMFYEKGISVKRNFKAAMQWYFTAAKKGSEEAKQKLKMPMPVVVEEPKEEEKETSVVVPEPQPEPKPEPQPDEYIETTLALNSSMGLKCPYCNCPLIIRNGNVANIADKSVRCFNCGHIGKGADFSIQQPKPKPKPTPASETTNVLSEFVEVDISPAKMFANSIKFKGRISRMEFNLSLLLYYIALCMVGAFSDFLHKVIILILANLFLWAQSAKRCHDRGNSGWCQLNPIYTFWLILGKSDAQPNQYGHPPYGFCGRIDQAVLDQMTVYYAAENKSNRLKNNALLVIAAIVAITLPLCTTFYINRTVANLTGQWYLSGISRIFITIFITTATCLTTYLLIMWTSLKKNKIFLSGCVLLTFLWAILVGLVAVPD